MKKKSSLPWISGEILRAIHQKETVRKKLKHSPNEKLIQKYKELRSRVKRMISTARKHFFNSLSIDLINNPKRFWSVFKLGTKKCNLPETVSMKTNNNTREKSVSSNSESMANLFNKYFSSVFHAETVSSLNTSDHNQAYDEHCLTDIEFTEGEVLFFLKQLDANKATGPDGIPNRILKETSEQIAPSLCKLFNMSLQTGCFPSEWSIANVVPVFKKGDADCVENYRPISLLSNISKLLERCVLNKIRDHVLQYMQSDQHGFVPGKSCTSQLVQVMELIGEQLDAGHQTDIVYLDMSKAFDKVRHNILLEKLNEIDIQGNLHSWFASYLLGRKQRVTIPGATSPTLPVTSGVPQGSVLGPILFLIYINNIQDTVSNSNIACFADDTKVFKTIHTRANAQQLQDDLNSLNIWSSNSGLTFNEQKTKLKALRAKRHQ